MKGKVAQNDVSEDEEKAGTVIVKKAQEITGEALGTVGKVWEQTEDKPATVVLISAGVFALYAANAVVTSLDDMPLIGNFFKLVGLLVTAIFTNRYLLPVEGRKELYTIVNDTFKELLGMELKNKTPDVPIQMAPAENDASSPKM